MSMLKTVSQKRVAAGEYPAVLLSYEERVASGGENILLTFALPTEGINVKHVVFPSNVDYVAGTLKRQAGMEDQTLTLEEILDAVKGLEIKMWISYNQYGRNVAFHDASASTTAQDSSAMPY